MSTTSPARVEANRKNAAHSTGPKTPEGKIASRANSYKHGLTGDGVVAPSQDLARVEELARNIRNKHRPITPVGLAMADRAALMLARLDRAGTVELAIIDDSVLTAVADFDQFRIDWADDLFGELESNPSAIEKLQEFPEGIDRLIVEWTSLASVEEWSPENLARLARISEAGRCTPAVIRSMIPGEIGRLEDIKASIDRTPIEVARNRAANLALFPTTREAILARKYEAATERAYHKAIRTLHEAEATGESPIPAPELAQPPTPMAELGSFLPEPVTPVEPAPRPEPSVPVSVPVAPIPPVDRSKRPDPRKLREAMKRKRR